MHPSKTAPRSANADPSPQLRCRHFRRYLRDIQPQLWQRRCMTNRTASMPTEPIAAAKWLFDETVTVYEENNHDRAHTDYFFATMYSAARECFTDATQEAFIVDIALRIQNSELNWLLVEPAAQS